MSKKAHKKQIELIFRCIQHLVNSEIVIHDLDINATEAKLSLPESFNVLYLCVVETTRAFTNEFDVYYQIWHKAHLNRQYTLFDLVEWMFTPMEYLKGQTPQSMIDKGKSKELINFIHMMEYG